MVYKTSDKLIAYLTLFSGLTISAVAIYYSVAGLVAIFSAAVIPIIVMGVAFIALGTGGSLVFGTIFWYLFGQSGFIPGWLLWGSLALGILLIINRGGG